LHEQHRPEEERTEALHAADIYGKLGAAKDAERCGELLRDIEQKLNTAVASAQSGLNCELL
jgi:hypothetical protein